MAYTYDRNCGHCKPSKYVQKVTVKELLPIAKADKLEIVTFNEIGYTTVGAKGLYKVGQAVYFLPGETIVPRELSDKMGVTDYLATGRVKTIRLRGERSEGLIGSVEQVEPYLDGILKWEDPPVQYYRTLRKTGLNRLTGTLFSYEEVPTAFTRFYDMPALKNSPNEFKIGENVVTSCKLHGMNARFAVLPRQIKWWARPFLRLINFLTFGRYGNLLATFVGSHNCVLDPADEAAWQTAYNKYLAGKLPEGYVFFGEVFGKFRGANIQHLTYGREDLDLRLFAAVKVSAGHYLLPQEFEALCDLHGLPCVIFHPTVFTTPADFYAMAEAPSEMTTLHHREGIVICSMDRRGVFAKVVSVKYLEDNKRTETH